MRGEESRVEERREKNHTFLLKQHWGNDFQNSTEKRQILTY